MQESAIKLHDIKPLIEVVDYSLYYLVGVILLWAILLGGASYLLYRYFKTKNRYNKRKDYAQKIMNLDLSKSKESAYAITHYGALFVDDSTRHKEMYENLTQRLTPYKYKKEVEPFDDEVLGYIELYRGMLDV